jgi:hypothetical protein
MAPRAGVRVLEAAQHRDAPARELGQLGGDRVRVKLVQHFGPVAAPAFRKLL